MDELSESAPRNRNESMVMDSIARAELSEAARWAKFLAIMGFIGCAIIVIIGVCLSMFVSYLNSSRYTYTNGAFHSSRTGFIWIFYVIGSLLFFFRCLFLYRFAVRMKSALHQQSQEELNESFQNLKRLFKYNGILTIVVLLIYAIFLLAGMIFVLNR